jgi:hypothetical protein
VTTDAHGARVTWTENGEAREEQVSGVVLSVPAPLVPRLYPQLDSGLRELLDSIPQGNIVSLRFALDTRPDVDALLTLVPKSELGGLALVMFEHNLSSDVAPAGRGLIGVLLYHEWCTPRLELSDDELADATLCDLEHLVPGVTGQVEFTEVTRWTPGATRSEPGMHRRIAELDRPPLPISGSSWPATTSTPRPSTAASCRENAPRNGWPAGSLTRVPWPGPNGLDRFPELGILCGNIILPACKTNKQYPLRRDTHGPWFRL